MHVHLSVVDSAGKNLFAEADGEDSALLKRTLAGMIALMPASMAVLAPNVNAFRRFQPGMYVPVQASWGITTVPWRCAFPVAMRRTTAWSTALPVPMPTLIWWWRRSWRGCCTARYRITVA
ncbi:Gamma-glutamylputrescine synthetase PuuA [Serratia fonticola]|uniref:Gamma-glutamylputrescine synthetase PuuA n=1 Tax=Serratia fonticola TaxID=47917 RepID=A0A4U9TUN2_SERFO|nr:Gamma-glutamylputrescine synthetase PuuA [Serratia fonticola]